jgi:hypothetical protein
MQPALQGGLDYTHSSGIYLGTWASNVSGNQFPNGAGLEWDFYGGYKFPAGPVGVDLGLLHYWYPGAYYNGFVPNKPKFNNTEIYGALTWNWLSLKYSHTTSDFFGVKGQTYGAVGCGVNSNNTAVVGCTNPIATTAGSKGSGYLDLTATYELSKGMNLIGHYGRQTVKNYGQLNYSDWKLGMTYEALGFTWGASYIDTDAEARYYRVAPASGNPGETKYIGKGTVVLSVAKTF